MHELSIVSDLVKLCENNLKKNNATKVLKIELKIGRLSGVEVHYLQSCFDVFKDGTVCEGAELIIHEQNVVISCKECGFKGELNENDFVCPKCSSNELDVVDGEDMYLMRLEME